MILFCDTSALVLEITPELTRLAGDYAEAFALRAYDSIQLAAAQTLNQELPGEVGFGVNCVPPPGLTAPTAPPCRAASRS